MNRRRRLVSAVCCLALLGGFALSNLTTAAEPAPGKVLRHVVLFKFKDSVTREQTDEIVRAFADLKNKIDTIVEFEHGTDNSPEKLSDGLTHAFVASFKSEKDRDDYLPHPEHKKFVKLLDGKIDKVVVVDYWATKAP